MITRRLFLGGAAAVTIVTAALIVPQTGLILPAKPEVIVDWLPCDGRAISKTNYPELYKVFQSAKGCVFGEDALTFNLPGYGAGRLVGRGLHLQPSLIREVSVVDLYVATREVVLPSGLIVLPGTLMPKENA